MRTARAKGLSQGKSLFKHALRNAILPVVTYLGAGFWPTRSRAGLIVEKIFTIPGLGDSFVSSITGRDLYGHHGNHDLPGPRSSSR